MPFIKRLSLVSMFVALLSSQVGAQTIQVDANGGIVDLESIVVNELIIGSGSQLNLYSNSSWGLIRETSFDQIWDYTASGFNGGTWDGPGIISGWAKDHPSENGRLAVISGADYLYELGYLDFHGQEVLSTDTLIQYTVYGDSTLDGVVDGWDAYYVAHAEEVRGTPYEVPNNWLWGNYNYCAVPEPSSIALLLFGAMGVLGFVYKKKRK
jgi:hypothetical protein